MTHPSKVPTMTLLVPLIAASTVVIAFVTVGQTAALGALAGGVVSVLNWIALRWFLGRLAAGGVSQAGVMILLVAKMGVLMLAVYVLISRLALDPLGVLLGLSTLFLAPVLGGVLRAPVHGSTAAPSAREER